MLLACKSCHRQYEVGGLAPGRQVRCACGARNRVPERRVLERQMAHCGNCGAELPAEEKTCAHCEARVTLAEEGLGEPCPECFARLPKGARFCHACGAALKASGVLQALTTSTCPRCAEALSGLEGAEHPYYQCTSCAGLWLSREAFRAFVDRALARGATPAEQRRVAAEVGMRGKRARSKPLASCPVCGGRMTETEFARYSAVVVDQCLLHGWWFDGGELEALEPFVRGGGLAAAEKRVRARRRSRKMVEAWRRRCAGESGTALRMGRPRNRRRRGANDFLSLLAELLA